MVEIYIDGADLATMEKYAKDKLVRGFTTNPSLMKKAGITKYREFAKCALDIADGKPVSFEVLSDDWTEMERQANTIASWSSVCYIKIPITNTKGESSIPLIQRLIDLRLNITAVMSQNQLESLRRLCTLKHIISVFNGRIMDTGKLPLPIGGFKARVLWASSREAFNVVQARHHGYDIITLSPELFEKYVTLRDKNLEEYSLETVKQFHNDGKGIEF